MLPRPGLNLIGALLVRLGLLPCRFEGRSSIPRSGGAVLVANHASYLDFLYVAAAAAPRRVCFLVTAEAYRGRALRLLLRGGLTIPVRRYRTNTAACRQMLRMLEAGFLVGVHVEGERSTLGRRQPALPGAARVHSRLRQSIVPLGISGSYDVGPRWSGVLRRRQVTVRCGPPIQFRGPDPAAQINAALAALVAEDPQPVHLAGLPAGRIARVIWRCPRCLDERHWHAAELSCEACGGRWEPTRAGLLRSPDGAERTFAEVAEPSWLASEPGPLRMPATAWREPSLCGPIEPLLPLGRAELTADADGLRFGALFIPSGAMRATSTERDNALNVATPSAMLQFRPEVGSVFRLQLAVDRWRSAGVLAQARRSASMR